MQHSANDFVGLPIIVSDYDAILNHTKPQSNSARDPSRPSDHSSANAPSSPTTTTTASSPSASVPANREAPFAAQQNWATGFNDFVDGLWSQMSAGVKQKLREACVEVLRRTEDPGEEERLWGVWDEDARLLD